MEQKDGEKNKRKKKKRARKWILERTWEILNELLKRPGSLSSMNIIFFILVWFDEISMFQSCFIKILLNILATDPSIKLPQLGGKKNPTGN